MAKLVSQQLDEIQAKLDYLMLPVNTSAIKSIQQVSGFSSYYNSSSDYGSYTDVTIATVNPAKTVVLLQSTNSIFTYSYGTTGTSTTNMITYYARLQNATTVRVGQNQASNSSLTYRQTVYAVVIEYQ